MGNSLYIEPFSGVSGDMFLSALCGLADAYEEIIDLPHLLDLPDGKIEINELNKNGIVCRHLRIEDRSTSEPNVRGPSPGHASHSHRQLSDIVRIIDAGRISDKAKEIAKDIFTIIGESEARIHNIPIERIHFHELSGVDSILDIVGCAVLIDRLEIDATYSDPVCTGFGNVHTQHGLLPVPAPATADILKGVPTFKGNEEGERATPTGAAILKYLRPLFVACPRPTTKIAYGPGQKDFEGANVLRLSLLEQADASQKDSVYVIETNIDDMSAELLGSDFQQALLTTGALDFHFTHIQMKKSRPAVQLTSLVSPSHFDAVADFILENTSTIGIRYYKADRKTLERHEVTLETPFGTLSGKTTFKPSGAEQVKYDHEALKDIAHKQKMSIICLKQKLKDL